MNLHDQRAAVLKAAQETIDSAKAEDRDLTEAELETVEANAAEIEDLDSKIKGAAETKAVFDRIAQVVPANGDDSEGDRPGKSLGEHFVKSVGNDGLARIRTMSGATIAAPEWLKAAADPQSTPAGMAPWLGEYDRTVVRGFRRPTVADLFGTGTLSGNAVSYLVEGSVAGNFTAVSEGNVKPHMNFADPDVKTAALRKVAGVITIPDEMIEDAAFWVSEINQRGLYMLSLVEEAQLLSGSGNAGQIEGLLTNGDIDSVSANDNTDNADALFRAMTKVQTNTGLSPDGIVMNPADYQALRLQKDSNGQYFGGGFFAGPYGQGGVTEQPPLWGLRTVVSPSVSAGTAIVGAFNQGATVYRKGGIRVESTNSHKETFVSNLVTTRIEERLAFAVRNPTAFIEVTLSSDDPVTE